MSTLNIIPRLQIIKESYCDVFLKHFPFHGWIQCRHFRRNVW